MVPECTVIRGYAASPGKALEPLHTNHTAHGAIRAFALNVDEDHDRKEKADEKSHWTLLPPVETRHTYPPFVKGENCNRIHLECSVNRIEENSISATGHFHGTARRCS
jgi:hypothetical protein